MDPLTTSIEAPTALNTPQPLIDLLTGQRPASTLTSDEARSIDSSAAFHGVDGLIWQQLRKQQAEDHPGFAQLARRARLQAQWELSHCAAVADLLGRCVDAKIPLLLLKGTALAYSAYPAPSLRSRGDTDLLIEDKDRQRTAAVLAQAGFKSTGPTSPTDLQAGYERIDPSGARHVIDLHWSASNSPLLENVWCFEELDARSQRLPALSPVARGLSKVDALIHACLHWAINRHVPYHYGSDSRTGGDRLIWLYDMKLLAESLDATDLADLHQQLSTKRLASVCLPALRSAQSRLKSKTLADLIEQIAPLNKATWRAWALNGGWLRRSFGEFVATRNRAGYLRDLLVASPEALHARYPNDPRSLQRLQLQRWLDGIKRRSGR